MIPKRCTEGNHTFVSYRCIWCGTPMKEQSNE